MRPCCFRAPLFTSGWYQCFLLPCCSSSFIHRFFFPSFFFSFLFPSHPGLFALHSPLPHSYAGHILSPLESFCSALSTCQSLLFAVPFLLGYFASDNTQGTQIPSGRLLPKLNEELRDLVIFLRSSSFVLRIRRAPHFTSVYYSSSRLPSFLQWNREPVTFIHLHKTLAKNSPSPCIITKRRPRTRRNAWKKWKKHGENTEAINDFQGNNGEDGIRNRGDEVNERWINISAEKFVESFGARKITGESFNDWNSPRFVSLAHGRHLSAYGSDNGGHAAPACASTSSCPDRVKARSPPGDLLYFSTFSSRSLEPRRQEDGHSSIKWDMVATLKKNTKPLSVKRVHGWNRVIETFRAYHRLGSMMIPVHGTSQPCNVASTHPSPPLHYSRNCGGSRALEYKGICGFERVFNVAIRLVR